VREVARDVSGGELSALLGGERRPIVLDVRSSAEFAAGHIQGAVHVPFWAVPWRSGRLRAAPDDPIVVYCGHGPRALFARSALRRLGFMHVACLAGHMAQWRREGRPEVRGSTGLD
jgi:rhodanese-related sulfurtransferase